MGPRAIGDTFDHFEIESVLGEGGMGTVYRARDTRLHRHVALKVMRPDAPGGNVGGAASGKSKASDASARLMREARLAAALDHPNAVAIFEVGEVGDTLYVAMELVDGLSLRAYVDGSQPASLERKVRILADVARALGAAHGRGLVHRDVKPENVIVRPDGVVKVLDFGIAKRFAPDAMARPRQAVGAVSEPDFAETTTLARKGSILGTPRYMSPEQVRGEPLDSRSDQFAWGVLAYEVLSGVNPWHAGGEGVNLLLAVASRAPKPLGDRVPELAPEIIAVVARCMAKDPRSRFDTMADVLGALGIDDGTGREGDSSSPDVSMNRSAGTARSMRAPATIRALGSASMRPEATRDLRAGARKRRAWVRNVGYGASLVVGAVVVAIASSSVGRWVARGRAPLAVASATPETQNAAAPIATALTALPPPVSTSAAAVASYQQGVRAFRDATFDSAQKAFARAIELDPEMAAAHLRIAMLESTVSAEQADARRSYSAAQQRRGNLSEHDATLLDALEPYFQSDPPDLAACEARLRVAVARFPGDAELAYYLGFMGVDRGNMKSAAAAFEKALSLDPGLAEAWAGLAGAQIYVGEFDGALKALDKCAEVSPAATDCIWYRTLIDSHEGRCAALENDVRRWIAKDPDDYYGYEVLARSLVAQHRERETVHAVLEQKWAKMTPERTAKAKALDELDLALLDGDFTGAEFLAKGVEERAAHETDVYEHAVPALHLVDIYTEMGDDRRARQVAVEFLQRKDAWRAPHRVEDNAILSDPVPTFLALLRTGGAASDTAFATKRAAWLAAWQKKTSEAYVGFLWISAYAFPAATPHDAETALASLAPFAPLPPFLTGARAATSIGKVYALAGRYDEALPYFKKAAASCTAMEDPVSQTRAHLQLGLAQAARGDKAAACASLGVVDGRWRNAKPRSMSAKTAQSAMAKLGCAR